MTATATIAAETALPTAEAIADLFLEHDVLPWQTIYLSLPDDTMTHQMKCAACAIGILLIAERGGPFAARSDCFLSNRNVKAALKAETDLPLDWLDGLDDGFSLSDDRKDADRLMAQAFHDRDSCSAIGIWDESLYREGFRVGWRAWALAKVEAGRLAEPRP